MATQPLGRTHQVTNQPPPLVGHDVAAGRCCSSPGARRRRLVPPGPAPAGPAGRRRAGPAVGRRGQPARARAAHARPVRQPDRRGRVPSVLAPLMTWRSEGLAGAPWADPRPGAHVARAAGFHGLGHRRARPPLSDLDDVRRRPRAARRPGLAAASNRCSTTRVYDPGLRAPLGKRGLLAGMGMTEKQGGSDVRANSTLAAPNADGSWSLSRAQVVHQRADERPVPRARAGARRAVLLPGAPGAAGRQPQRVPDPAAQGQARQPQQRQQRARVRQHRRLAGRATGSRGAHHHRDGEP